MSNVATPSPSQQASVYPPPIALGELWPWVLFAAAMMTLVYFVGLEEGAVSLGSGTFVHEFVHDGRHLLGFPCH